MELNRTMPGTVETLLAKNGELYPVTLVDSQERQVAGAIGPTLIELDFIADPGLPIGASYMLERAHGGLLELQVIYAQQLNQAQWYYLGVAPKQAG